MMRWLLAAAFVLLVDAGSWRHVRVGQPFVDLPDFVLHHYRGLGSHNGPVPKPVEVALSNAVGLQGLELDTDTVTNGDCGLDAVLRNLERLQLAKPEAVQILRVLEKKGRQAALQAMRFMMLIWIRKNQNIEVAPDLTLGQLATMEGHASVEQYIMDMKKQGTWIDTPMLLAASHVFHIQMICFVGQGEAQLLAAPEITALSEDVPIAFIANANNVHFYSCRPANSEDSADECADVGDDHDDPLLVSLVPQPNDGRFIEEVEEPSEGQLSRATPGGSLDTRGSNLFALCQCLNRWDPFGRPDERVLDLLKVLEGALLTNTSGIVLEVLQYRDAVKLLQWESLEAKLDREYVYQVAKKAMMKPSSHGRYNIFQKSRKLFVKLVLSKVEAGLLKECQPGHSCTKPFLQHAASVLRWRKLWYAMPKHDREAKLAEFFANQVAAHRESRLGDPTGFTAKFQVFGTPVCRNAFIAITGIHADTLQKARGLAMGTALPALPAHGVWVMRRPLVYIITRAWLLTYAKTHGDTSPLEDLIYLPAGRKECSVAGNIIHRFPRLPPQAIPRLD
jgi:hypothetical protein